MITGTLKLNIDTTLHDLYDAICVMRQTYGSWTRPKELGASGYVAYEMGENRGLWADNQFDPRPTRYESDYVSRINTDKLDVEDFKSCFRLMLWDAMVSYRSRAERVLKEIQDMAIYPDPYPLPLFINKIKAVEFFMNVSFVLRNYHSTLVQEDVESRLGEANRIVRTAYNISIDELKEKIRIAEEFTKYS